MPNMGKLPVTKYLGLFRNERKIQFCVLVKCITFSIVSKEKKMDSLQTSGYMFRVVHEFRRG